MAKRKLLDVERKIIERDLERVKGEKDFITERFVNDIQALNDSIKRLDSWLKYGMEEDEGL